MIGRITVVLMLFSLASSADARDPTESTGDKTLRWRSVGDASAKEKRETARPLNHEAEPGAIELASHSDDRVPVTRITTGSGTLPNTFGQIWREYDIRPYTSRFPNSETPQQTLVDWILRETGTEKWFAEPLGILSATRETLTVYHTPETHGLVSRMVDRFVGGQVSKQLFSIRVLTVESPNWRNMAQRMLRPTNIQSPGAEAWVLSREESALVLAGLRKRNDFFEIGAPGVLVRNGEEFQSRQTRPIAYSRSVAFRPQAWPNYEIDSGRIDVGHSLQFSPLLSLDANMVDAVIKWSVNQVERFDPVSVDVPTTLQTRQAVQVQVPRHSSFDLHERFQWRSDQVLLISCGMVASPIPENRTRSFVKALSVGPARRDVLLLAEYKGPERTSAGDAGQSIRSASLNVRGRY